MRERRTGRPHGPQAEWRSGSDKEGSERSQAERFAKPFLHADGLGRLKRTLRTLDWHHGYAGRSQKLADILSEAAGEAARWNKSRPAPNPTQNRREKKEESAGIRAETERKRELRKRAKAGDADAAHQLREEAIAEASQLEARVFGKAEGEEARRYYDKHMDALGRLPRGVPQYPAFFHERMNARVKAAERIRRAGEAPSMDAIAD